MASSNYLKGLILFFSVCVGSGKTSQCAYGGQRTVLESLDLLFPKVPSSNAFRCYNVGLGFYFRNYRGHKQFVNTGLNIWNVRGRVFQWLRVHTALKEDLRVVPSIYVRQLRCTCDSSYSGIWLHRHPYLHHIPPPHTHILLKIKLKSWNASCTWENIWIHLNILRRICIFSKRKWLFFST